MARTRKTVQSPSESTLTPIEKNINESPDRFKMSEMAYSGLNIFDGVSVDELKKELNFPYNIKTYKQMSYHSTINAALTLYEGLILKASWRVVAPQDATEEELRQTEFIRECMKDMDQTWNDFLREVLSCMVYGFAVHEKVYRRRNKSSGSKFNDNLIGWKRLPLRTQETIEKFLFSSDGNDITGVVQNISTVFDPYGRYLAREKEVKMPRSKFMLFRTGRHRGDPFGKSPLRDAYLAWRYLTAIEEIEANGVAKDLNGVPTLWLPPEYLSKDATPAQQATRAFYENAIRNLQVNQQSGMILPLAYDPETKQPLFKMELLSQTSSGKNFDITKIKEYYKNMILTSLFADILTMGQTATGSYALGSIKTSLIGVATDSIAKSICEVLNQDLIRQTYELNGWNTSRMCHFDYENIETPDLDNFSRFVQRIASVNMMTKDLDTINKIRDTLGLDPLSPDSNWEELIQTDNESGAGEGMATPFAGTATSGGTEDSASDNNLENS